MRVAVFSLILLDAVKSIFRYCILFNLGVLQTKTDSDKMTPVSVTSCI